MLTKNLKFLFIIFVIYLRVSETLAQQNYEQICSRQKSKFIREFFVKALMPIYHRYSVPIPNNCKFSPLNDIYYNQENNKTKIETRKWKCEYCGKIFIDEAYLDLHFINKHNNTYHLRQDGKVHCLADLCKIFRCDVLQSPKLSFMKKHTCNEGTVQHLKQICDDLVHECIPNSASRAVQNNLENELNRQLCSYLTCSKYHDLPEFLNQGPNFLKIFLGVFFLGICIIVYAVINHTDLIYNENEIRESVTINNDTSYESCDDIMNSSVNTDSFINHDNQIGTNDIRLRKPHVQMSSN